MRLVISATILSAHPHQSAVSFHHLHRALCTPTVNMSVILRPFPSRRRSTYRTSEIMLVLFDRILFGFQPFKQIIMHFGHCSFSLVSADASISLVMISFLSLSVLLLSQFLPVLPVPVPDSAPVRDCTIQAATVPASGSDTLRTLCRRAFRV